MADASVAAGVTAHLRSDLETAFGVTWTAPQLLLTRGEDMLRLGVAWRNASLQPPAAGRTVARLQADRDASLILILPPQALTEHVLPPQGDGTAAQDARLAGRSEMAFGLAEGTAIELALESILAAVQGRALIASRPGDFHTLLELPTGLFGTPIGQADADDAPWMPARLDFTVAPGRSPAGVAGVWHATLSAPDGALRYHPLLLLDDDAALADAAGGHATALDGHDRASILIESGQGGAEAEIALGALGATLSAALRTPTFGWAHRIAVGRDDRVTVVQEGFLHPLGHRAQYVTAGRRVVTAQGVAGIAVREHIIVTEPVRTGTRPDFRFSPVEILWTDVEVVAKVDCTTRALPVEALLTAKQQALDEATARRAAAAADMEAAARIVPRSVSQLAQSGDPGAGDAQQLLELQFEAGSAQAAVDEDEKAIAALKERIAILLRAHSTHGGGGIHQIDNPDGDVTGDNGNGDTVEPTPLQEAEAALGETQKKLELDRQTLQGLPDFSGLAAQVNAELAALPNGDPDYEAARARQVEAQADIDAIGGDTAEINRYFAEALPTQLIAFRPSVDGATPLSWPVRLGTPSGDLDVHMPLFFVADTSQPGNQFFPDYASLADPALAAALDRLWVKDVPVAGMVADLVGASVPQPGDIHEVHGISIGATIARDGIRPTISSLTVKLPSLRTLLPDQDGLASLAYAAEGGLADVALTASPPIPIDFTGHADRSGGLVAPKYAADALSRTLGPVVSAALPSVGLPDLASVYENCTLLGLKLGALIDTAIKTAADEIGLVSYAPKIAPIIVDGKPAGATIAWSGLPLKSEGIFLAGQGGSTLDLLVKTTANGNETRCTVTNFGLQLPAVDPVVTLFFKSLAMTQFTDRAPDVHVDGFSFVLGGALKLLGDLEDKVVRYIADNDPGIVVRQTADGISASYAFALPNVATGAFQLRNIAVAIVVDIPFNAAPVTVSLGFADSKKPFTVGVLVFGGGGYLLLRLGRSGVDRVELSIDFGAFVAVDFVVAKGEVHAYGAVQLIGDGTGTALQAVIRFGGSLSVLGIVSLAIELALLLTYDDACNQLAGRATLVIEIDVLFLSKSVQLDSGWWILSGPRMHVAALNAGRAAPLPPGAAPPPSAAPAAPGARGADPGDAPAPAGPDEGSLRSDWERYWQAFAA